MTPVETVRAYLADNEIEHDETSRDGVDGASFSLSLPGEKKLQTPVRLDVGPHALGVHAFVCRNPDENHARVHRWLLERNLRMYAVSFAVDRLGRGAVAHAQEFSWERTAERTLEAYARAAGRMRAEMVS